jgi:Kef-type K+ transport system membrane component KefB
MLMVFVMRLAAVLAALIQLPGIVAGFLAGLAVNAAVRDKPAKQKVQFFAELFLCCDRLLIHPP